MQNHHSRSHSPQFIARSAHHDAFEGYITHWLQDKGFIVGQAVHHEVLQPALSMRLKQIETPTSQYIRNRADRVAAHSQRPLVFQWDAKTHSAGGYTDMTVDATALAHHVWVSKMGVRTLMCYSNSSARHSVGFWCHELPPLREIHVPTWKWTEQEQERYLDVFTRLFPGVSVRFLASKSQRGSGTPYAIIDRLILEKLPDWRVLVERVLNPS